jgi:probable rRNA maturation factor
LRRLGLKAGRIPVGGCGARANGPKNRYEAPFAPSPVGATRNERRPPLNTQSPHDLPEDARRIEEALVLAVAYEPPEALDQAVFGLEDADLRRIVALTLARVGVAVPVELSLLLTGDDGLQALNREYRGKDEPTDVLSFPLLDAPLADAPDDQLWQAAGDEARDEARDEIADLGAMEYAVSEGDALDLDGNELASDGPDALDDLDLDGGDPFLTPEDEHVHLGDIALSRDTLQRQAAQAGHSPARELAYLLAHGVLHLVGYDDTTDAGYRAMVAHQEAVLAAAGIME